MTQTLTRPLTTENRVLRQVGGADLTVSLGQSLGIMPTLGDLTSLQTDLDAARETRTTDQIAQDLYLERTRAQEVADLTWRLQTHELNDRERADAFSRLSDINREAQVLSDERQARDAELSVTPEQLSEQYGELGLQFDRPMTKDEARILADSKRAEIIRDALMAKGPQGFMPFAARFGANLAAMATDPLEVATMFIPVVGQAGRAGAIARFGRVGGRVGVGAVEGAVGQAIVEPFMYALSRSAQLDYTMSDSLMNIGLGAVLGGGIGGVASVFARADAPPVTPGDVAPERVAVDDPGLRAFDEAMVQAKLIAEQRRVAETAVGQFINGRSVSVGPIMPARGPADAIAELSAELKDAQKYPLTNAIKRYGVHPDGAFAEELKAAGITSRTVPGLFRKDGVRDFDNLPAAEWFEKFPDLPSRAGVENGYLDPQGLVDAVISEMRGQGGGATRTSTDILREISELEIDADRIAAAYKAADAQGIRLRSDEEARFVAERMGDDLDAALDVIGAQRDAEIAAIMAREFDEDPLADVPASRDADIRMAPTFVEDHIAELDAMVRQMDMSEEMAFEMAAIAELEARAKTYAEVAEAAAVCLARTV
jgi:hypothetical protein